MQWLKNGRTTILGSKPGRVRPIDIRAQIFPATSTPITNSEPTMIVDGPDGGNSIT
ncbi:hypothetical protein [Glaciihabitans sp. UYNi722]|uniref:hypothetical protein n=1 Tax=Glaciihabitans sp. UYNi722 TaxID=3156344 RepID=UPI003395DDD1